MRTELLKLIEKCSEMERLEIVDRNTFPDLERCQEELNEIERLILYYVLNEAIRP